LINAHGGNLVNRKASPEALQELFVEAEQWPRLYLDDEQLRAVENIAEGLYSPLEGFMDGEDYRQVIENMRLKDGTLWPIPLVMGISKTVGEKFEIGEWITLANLEGKIFAILQISDIYEPELEKEARLVYQTDQVEHPGVAELYRRGEMLLGGKITLLRKIKRKFPNYYLTPYQTRSIFREKKWDKIVAFQTRNPIHRAHEYLQKTALESADGLFISPLTGYTKGDDISAELRIASYNEVLNNYYPTENYVMAIFPVRMHYAGPREAILHAICRQNYGCTHFIVGRDHAGVGNYYDTYAAQEIFADLSEDDLLIKAMCFEYAFYCSKCKQLATTKTCPHLAEDHIYLSGTKVRELLRKGQRPPVEMTRPEVADILINGLTENSKEN